MPWDIEHCLPHKGEDEVEISSPLLGSCKDFDFYSEMRSHEKVLNRGVTGSNISKGTF